jgi:hypothetical protein
MAISQSEVPNIQNNACNRALLSYIYLPSKYHRSVISTLSTLTTNHPFSTSVFNPFTDMNTNFHTVEMPTIEHRQIFDTKVALNMLYDQIRCPIGHRLVNRTRCLQNNFIYIATITAEMSCVL